MKRVNIHEAKTNLSRLLNDLEPMDVLVICRNNEPIAELRALPKRPKRLRPWGVDRGVFEVPKDINVPLSDDEIALWER